MSALALLLLAGFWTVPALGAEDILNTHGFDTGYTLGDLQGQSGTSSSVWLKAGGGVGSAVVENNAGIAGSRGLRVDRGANSDNRWAAPVSGFPTNRYILVDWDMKVLASVPTTAFGPFMGVDTYDATVTPRVLGSLGVDATTGDVLYQLGGSGVLAEVGARATFGQWHHYQIKLDFFLDQYQVVFDNSTSISTSFVDGATDTFTDADIAAFAAAFDPASQSQTGTAFYDNFLVSNVDRADFDIDGDVDAIDLDLWEKAFGSSNGADADFDGDTDGNDLLIWQRDYDAVVGTVASLSATTLAVPEPSSLLLTILFLLASHSKRSRKS